MKAYIFSIVVTIFVSVLASQAQAGECKLHTEKDLLSEYRHRPTSAIVVEAMEDHSKWSWQKVRVIKHIDGPATPEVLAILSPDMGFADLNCLPLIDFTNAQMLIFVVENQEAAKDAIDRENLVKESVYRTLGYKYSQFSYTVENGTEMVTLPNGRKIKLQSLMKKLTQ